MVECRIDVLGNKSWQNEAGKLHREADLPAVELATGDKEWYVNGLRHREAGPAMVYAGGSEVWYLNGKLHREDGPAVEYASGTKRWYLANERLSFDEYCIKLYGSLDHPKSVMLHVKYG